MPVIAAREQGLFFTYTQVLLNRQILLWLNEAGVIVREDTVSLPGVEFAFAEGSLCHLLTFRQDPWAWTETFAIHSFSEDGMLQDTVVLGEHALSPTDLHGGRAYDWDDGRLTIATTIAHNDPPPLHYTVRIIHYQDGGIQALPLWIPGIVPAGSYFFGWNVARGPWNSTILGFYSAGGSEAATLRFAAFDAEGSPSATVRIVDPGAAFSATALDVLAAHESVYVLYTAQPRGSDSLGGTFLAAFPLSDVLSEDRAAEIIPRSLSLAAFPNPFNAAVRIEYSFPPGGRGSLRIYDMLGREAADLTSQVRNRPAGQILWTPRGLPSGQYFASMNYADGNRTVKLILVR